LIAKSSGICTIFPPAIDGDLLKLVHLSNGFRVFDDAPALKVGDVGFMIDCEQEKKPVSVVRFGIRSNHQDHSPSIPS
jgi:hypothetical protein